jgi:predicted secreted protein
MTKETHYKQYLVTVDVALVGSLNSETKVLGLNGAERRELSVDVRKVESGNLLVEDLGEDVDTNVELAGLAELNVLLAKGRIFRLVEHDLGEDLVGERAGHDERRVAGGTAQVDEATLSEEDDVAAVLHQEAVNLGLDVGNALGVGLQPRNINLNVEVANVADNGIVGHLLEVLAGKDVTAASGGDKDLTLAGSLLHGHDLETRDSGLEGVDGVDLGDDDTGTHTVEGHGATLADITETGNNGDLASNHNIGGTLDTVNERLSATVQVVELGLGDTVVDVDGRNKETLALEHSVEVVNTGGGLLRDTVASLEHLGVLLVDESGQVTTIIQDQVQALAVLEGDQLLLEAPLVLLLGLTLPGENGDTSSGNGSSGVVLGGEDVARRPGNLSTKGGEGLNQDSGLDGHTANCQDLELHQHGTSELTVSNQRSWHQPKVGPRHTSHGWPSNQASHSDHNVSLNQRPIERVFTNLGELDLLATECGKRKVSDLELGSGSRHFEVVWR